MNGDVDIYIFCSFRKDGLIPFRLKFGFASMKMIHLWLNPILHPSLRLFEVNYFSRFLLLLLVLFSIHAYAITNFETRTTTNADLTYSYSATVGKTSERHMVQYLHSHKRDLIK